MHIFVIMFKVCDVLCILVFFTWILRVVYGWFINTIGWLVRMGWWFPKTVSRTMKENQARRDIEMAELDKIIDSRS